MPPVGEIQCWLFYEMSVQVPPESLKHCGTCYSVSSGSADVRSGASNSVRARC